MMVMDHIGVVVPQLEEAIGYWGKVFNYVQLTRPVVNTRQKVRVVFLKKVGSALIKLVEPTDESSPVYRLALKGGGLHHLCYRCPNVRAAVEYFRAQGLHVLSDPQPGEAFGGHDIAFVFGKQGLNIELIDTEIKAGLLEDKKSL